MPVSFASASVYCAGARVSFAGRVVQSFMLTRVTRVVVILGVGETSPASRLACYSKHLSKTNTFLNRSYALSISHGQRNIKLGRWKSAICCPNLSFLVAPFTPLPSHTRALCCTDPPVKLLILALLLDNSWRYLKDDGSQTGQVEGQ